VTAVADDILADLRDALRATGAFAAVTVGEAGGSARWPRAEIVFESLDDSPADDAASAAFRQLRASVRILARGSADGGALARCLTLAEAARAAVLADPHRGGRCRDLPIGRATEPGPVRLGPPVRGPHLAVRFEVRCHFQSEED
jgi:hypothetical protein